MNTDDALLAVIDALDRSGIHYMVVGSYSTNFYGVPRATRDADIVIQFQAESISELRKQLGPEFIFDPQMAFEGVTGTSKFNITMTGHQPFKIELFLLSDDAHDIERFNRRQKVRMFDHDVMIATAEDAIIMKVRWGRGAKRRKDLDDVVKVIRVQQNRLDWAYIEAWCDRHGSRDLLEELRKEATGA